MSTVRDRTEVFSSCQLNVVGRRCLLFVNCTWKDGGVYYMSTVRGRTELFTRCQLYVVGRRCLRYVNCTW